MAESSQIKDNLQNKDSNTQQLTTKVSKLKDMIKNSDLKSQ